MDRIGRVGLNRDWVTPAGYLVQIHRKFIARGKNKALAGRYIYPHLYFASYEQVATAYSRPQKGAMLSWVKVKDLRVVIENFLEPKI